MNRYQDDVATRLDKRMTAEELTLLQRSVEFHDILALPLLDKLNTVPLTDGNREVVLTQEERERLRSAVLDEFLRSGLLETDEPNEYGYRLEALIDLLGYQ